MFKDSSTTTINLRDGEKKIVVDWNKVPQVKFQYDTAKVGDTKNLKWPNVPTWVKDGEKCTMCQEFFRLENAYLLGTCRHPWHLARLAKFHWPPVPAIARRQSTDAFIEHRSRGIYAPGDGLHDIETRYKIQHGDTTELILQEFRSLPEGMQPWFCQSKNGWYDTSEGGPIGEYREGVHPQQRWWRSDGTKDPHGVVDDVLKMWGAEQIRANTNDSDDVLLADLRRALPAVQAAANEEADIQRALQESRESYRAMRRSREDSYVCIRG